MTRGGAASNDGDHTMTISAKLISSTRHGVNDPGNAHAISGLAHRAQNSDLFRIAAVSRRGRSKMTCFGGAKFTWIPCLERANLQVTLGGHAHVESPLRTHAGRMRLPEYDNVDSQPHLTRRDGRVYEFRDGNGNLIRKSVRIQATAPGAACPWACVCNHGFRGVVFEGITNVPTSARYPPQLCAVLAKHILARPHNLSQLLRGSSCRSQLTYPARCSRPNSTMACHVPDEQERHHCSQKAWHRSSKL